MGVAGIVGDRYEVGEKAGSGGMGSVFRARDLRTGDTVALKLVDGGGLLTARFEREVMALARLSVPGVVRYLGHGEAADGKLFLAMEWLDGEVLSDRLARGPLGIRESLRLARAVARTLARAHELSIVHRDIKPANLLLVGGDLERVKVLDFGVARVADAEQAVTRPGLIVGTPGYLAPEQARGDADIDGRADVFALGCVLFECIAGEAAFQADRILGLLAKVLFAGAPRLGEVRDDVPAPVEELVACLLSTEPDARPADGAETAALLDELLSSGEVPAERRSVQPGIGELEQRLLSVVVAAGARAAEAQTMSLSDMGDRHRVLGEVADRFGARFEPVVDGSALFILSGTGDARQQAARAARCALAVHEAAGDLAVSVATGSGVATGRVPVGEVIDRAVEIVDGAGTTVCVDEVTAGLLDEGFVMRTGDDGARLLIEERHGRRPARTLLGRAMPCVGRDRELRILTAVLEDSFEQPAAGALLITGPAGIGKSRLRDELVSRPVAAAATLWTARGDPMRAGAPFALLASALGPALDLTGSEPPARAHQRVRVAARRVVGEEQAPRVATFLAELCSVPFPGVPDVQLAAARRDPQLMEEQLRRAFVDFVAGICRSGPLLVVLEDLHWADAPSVALVGAALDAAEELPLVVVATARPEVHERFDDLWKGAATQEVRLSTLPRRASVALVHEALGRGVDPRVVDRLVQRSDGNPFFLEELLRAEAAGRGDEAPPTLLAVVRARLEELDPEARRVMRAASVFGSAFTREAVGALVKGGDLEGWLGELERREVLMRVSGATGAGADHAQLAFRHALLRDAAYAMLTDEDRELGHRLAANWLEGRGAEAIVVAEHYELGAEPARAAPCWHRAASEAFESNDLDGALACVGHAVRCGASGRALGALRLIESEAERWRSRYDRAEKAALEAVDLLEEGSEEWCRALVEVAGSRSRHGEGAVDSIVDRLVDATEGRELSPSLTVTFARLALILRHSGSAALSARIERRAREVISSRDPSARAWLHSLRASGALFSGDLSTFLEEERGARAGFREMGAAVRALNAAINVGYALTELGAYGEAVTALREVLEEAERLGAAEIGRVARHNLGRALAGTGALTEALRVERAAARQAGAAGDVRVEGGSYLYISAIHLRLGDGGAAESAARRAADRLDAIPTLRPYARAAVAAALCALGRAREGLAESAEAVRELEDVGELEEGETFVRLVHAEALGRAGRRVDARQAAARARSLVEARAGRIRDEALRRSFLTNVPENARVLALAAQDPPGGG